LLEIDGVEIDFSASIGIAIYPDQASDIESLIKCADIACYRAKDSGRNNFKIYGSDMKLQVLTGSKRSRAGTIPCLAM